MRFEESDLLRIISPILVSYHAEVGILKTWTVDWISDDHYLLYLDILRVGEAQRR